MYQTLLLDIDGTLLDFQKSEEESLNRVFREHGYELTPEMRACYEKINRGLWDSYERGEIDRDTVIFSRFGMLFEQVGIQGEDGVQFEKEYQEYLGQKAHLIPGAYELVEYLSKKYTLYVVTNGVTHTQWQRLQDSGLDKFMRDVFISGELGSQKPQKEFFDACFAKMQEAQAEVDKSAMLIIGDSLSSDILGGNNAGVDTCWYNPAGKAKADGISVTMEVRKLEELYTIL